VGHFLVKGGETIRVDSPLARAVRAGGICYLDEIVEARKDITVVIHPRLAFLMVGPSVHRYESGFASY